MVLAGDSETRRSQKAISTSLMFAGGIITILNIILNLSLGITTVGAIYSGWAIFIFSAAFLVLWLPRFWLYIFSIALLVIVPMVLLTHVFSGGYQSGLEAIVWLLQILIAASLFIGPRFTIVALLTYVVGVLIAAFLESPARSVAPELPLGTRMQIAASNMIYWHSGHRGRSLPVTTG